MFSGAISDDPWGEAEGYQWNTITGDEIHHPFGDAVGTVGWDNGQRFHSCEDCGAVKVEFLNDYFHCPECGAPESCRWDSLKIEKAIVRARSARFEHGEMA